MSLSSMMRDFDDIAQMANHRPDPKYKVKGDITTGKGMIMLAQRLLRDFLAGKISERRFEVAMRGIRMLAQLKKQFKDELPEGLTPEEVAEAEQTIEAESEPPPPEQEEEPFGI